jgi:enoyl-CoA hydratase/carnithine racemase
VVQEALMAERVQVAIDAGIADVRLNRPEKINAIDLGMFKKLSDAGESLKSAPGVRVVVLSGAGRGFCAGLDYAMFRAMAETTERTRTPDADLFGTNGGTTHLGQQAAWVWSELDVPVIAAIHGACMGGGLQIALGADIRIVAPDASLSVREIVWGMTPDMTASLTLPGLVGLDVAKELFWTGRTVSGTEAVHLGMATRTAVDPRAAAFELATDVASKNPDAVQAGKRLLTGRDQRSVAEQLALERREIAAVASRPNHVEAMTAHFEGRAPVFGDRAS